MKSHEYALLDKKGKCRGTCIGAGPNDHKGAASCFRAQRNGRAIPDGWEVVDRGPKEDTPDRKAEAKKDPCPFKIGDWVRVIAGSETGRSGVLGGPKGNWPVSVQFAPKGAFWGYHLDQIELVKQGEPQPQADAKAYAETIREMGNTIGRLMTERDAAQAEATRMRRKADGIKELYERELGLAKSVAEFLGAEPGNIMNWWQATKPKVMRCDALQAKLEAIEHLARAAAVIKEHGIAPDDAIFKAILKVLDRG